MCRDIYSSVRICLVCFIGKNISGDQSRSGRFIKASRHCIQRFFCLPGGYLIILHSKSNELCAFICTCIIMRTFEMVSVIKN